MWAYARMSAALPLPGTTSTGTGFLFLSPASVASIASGLPPSITLILGTLLKPKSHKEFENASLFPTSFLLHFFQFILFSHLKNLYLKEGQKKVVLFPEIGQVNKILSPTLPHKSNVFENIYLVFQKNTQTNKKISTSKFLR